MSLRRVQREEQRHFQLFREATRAADDCRALPFHFLWFVSPMGEFASLETGSKRDPMATSVCRGHRVSPCVPLSSAGSTEERERERETSTLKDSLISEVHREESHWIRGSS